MKFSARNIAMGTMVAIVFIPLASLPGNDIGVGASLMFPLYVILGEDVVLAFSIYKSLDLLLVFPSSGTLFSSILWTLETLASIFAFFLVCKLSDRFRRSIRSGWELFLFSFPFVALTFFLPLLVGLIGVLLAFTSPFFSVALLGFDITPLVRLVLAVWQNDIATAEPIFKSIESSMSSISNLFQQLPDLSWLLGPVRVITDLLPHLSVSLPSFPSMNPCFSTAYAIGSFGNFVASAAIVVSLSLIVFGPSFLSSQLVWELRNHLPDSRLRGDA